MKHLLESGPSRAALLSATKTETMAVENWLPEHPRIETEKRKSFWHFHQISRRNIHGQG
jgi:hypothetical protein